MRIKWIILAVLVYLFTGRALADSSTVTVETYWDTLKALHARLQASEAPSEAEISEFADRLSEIHYIELESGDIIPVDHSYLAGLLQAGTPGTELAIRILGMTLSERELAHQQVFSPASTVLLDEILKRPEFQWQESNTNPFYELWQRGINWFLRLLTRLFPDTGNAGQLLDAAIIVVFGLILVGIFWYIYRSFLRNIVSGGETQMFSGPETKLSSEQAMARANALSNEGDQRTAVRYLYLSALRALEERGALRADRSRTNREVLEELSGFPELAGPFESITSIFDRVWYGYHPIERNVFKEYADQVKGLNKIREAVE